MVLGAALGVFVAGILSHYLGQDAGVWLVAPIGASAVLVFGLPSSPLAQPWSVLGGNTLSALVGTAVVFLFHDHLTIAAALAVALSIAVMLWGRCLHPPGGASALLVVLMQKPSLSFVLFAFLLNSALLIVAGLIYNNLLGRSYPHYSKPDKSNVNLMDRFTQSDLDAALAHYQELIDVDPNDLTQLLQYAESAAYQRTLGDLRCEMVMSRTPHSVKSDSSLSEAWELMRRHHVKALPVVDDAQHVVGIITLADFLTHANLDQYMAQPSSNVLSLGDKPEIVGQIMTHKVHVASFNSYLVALLPLFSQTGHHHLPVIDSENHLIGILTQSDVVRALVKAVRP